MRTHRPLHVLCSTGAFSRSPDRTDPAVVASGIRRLGGTGIEVIFQTPWYGRVDEIAPILRDTGADMPVLHTEKSIGALACSEDPSEHDRAVALLEENCTLATALGARTLVLHLWNQPETEASLARARSVLPRLLDATAAHGLDLSVESIWRTSGSPLAAIRAVLATDPRVRITLDTEFLAHHGELEAAIAADWLWVSGAVDHVQIKDYDGSMTDAEGHRQYLHPGQGGLDLAGFVRGLARRAYRGALSLEASAVIDAESVDFALIEQSLQLLRSWADGAELARASRA